MLLVIIFGFLLRQWLDRRGNIIQPNYYILNTNPLGKLIAKTARIILVRLAGEIPFIFGELLRNLIRFRLERLILERACLKHNVIDIERFLVKETSYAAFNRTLSVPLRPSSRVIPATVEAQFANRNVYTLVIPKPDLPEYADDWVLWFSERQPGEMLAPRISAPVPARKYSLVGGAPIASSAAGTLQLAAVVERTGRISAARILRGTAGDAFRRRALEELQTWEFHSLI